MITTLKIDITVKDICNGFIYNELEGKGLRFRRSMTAQAKRELGLSRGAPRQAVLDGLTVLIEQAGMNLKPGDIQP